MVTELGGWIGLSAQWRTPPAQSHKSLSLFLHAAQCPPSLPPCLLAKCSLTHHSFLQIEAKSAFSVKLGGNWRRTNGPRCYLGRIGQPLAGLGSSLHRVPQLCFFLHPQLYFAPQSTKHHFASQNGLFGIQLLQGVLITGALTGVANCLRWTHLNGIFWTRIW